MERTIRTGFFLLGAIVGLEVCIVVSFFDALRIDGTIPVVDLAQLLAALFLAIYIPIAIERLREKQKYTRDLLVSQVQEIVGEARSINQTLAECATTGVTDGRSRMHVRVHFLTCNIKLGRLESRLRKECGPECKANLGDFREAYDSYYDAVTGGSLYGDGTVDWNLWRSQEFCFIRLQNAGIDLAKFLSER